MRKATAFIAGFAAVLIAGAAVAQIGSAPAFDMATDHAIEQPLTKPETQPDKVEPVKEEPGETIKEEPRTEEPVKEEPHQEKPADVVADPPKDTPEDTEKPAKEPGDITPPPLAITSPTNGQVFKVKTVRFTGETEPGARVLAGDYEADVDATGRWSIVLILSPGGNLATFKAKDAAGNIAKASVEVIWQTEKTEEKDWQFTANQQYGSCGEDIPYDVFWGTGKPGSSILVLSDFGSADMRINEKGHWEVKVLFKEAPVGKTFLVKVKDAFGNYEKFEFTRTG